MQLTHLFNFLLRRLELGSLLFDLTFKGWDPIGFEFLDNVGRRLNLAQFGQFLLPHFLFFFNLFQTFGGQSTDLAIDLSSVFPQ